MSKQGKILIVDDDRSVLRSLEIFLDVEFEKVKTISNPNLILGELQSNKYDVVLLDMNFSAGINSGNEGLYWLKEILNLDLNYVVILITAYGDVNLAVNAMKEGATDFIIKPWNNDKLISTLKAGVKIKKSNDKIQQLSKEKSGLSEETSKITDKLIGSSIKMNQVYKIIDKVASTDANVLITGENGTGKELIAREIHRKSTRAGEPMIIVDLATIGETLFESELFGHKKGAFTDAHTDRTGRFEIASGGTLFLDEIGNVPVSLQSKILTALQRREIIPVGATDPVTIDIRLIAATNKDLEELISQGLFRDDLYYRINTIQIELPPLRERDDDILQIAEYFLKLYGSKYEKPFIKFSATSIDALQSYHWPGNIRELRHTIEKATILTESNSIQPDDLFLKVTKSDESESWPLKFEEIEKKAIIRAIQNNKGRLIDAAQELGLTRQTLYNKCKKYNIKP